MQRRGYMTQNKEIKTMDNSFMNSKFGKVLLTIVSVFLVFAGPTYVVYGLAVLIKVDLAASFAVGIVLFIVGLIMMRYLVQKKIIS
jgi:tetrahydromethanopterin S-methyltransferase subunit E